MSELEGLLAEVERLLVAVKVVEAESRLAELISTISVPELRIWEKDIRAVIDKFLPKRRRNLAEVLETRLKAESEEPKSLHKQQRALSDATYEISANGMLTDLKNQLDNLASYRIFQWNTFYRDALGTFFSKYVQRPAPQSRIAAEASEVRRLFALHAKQIYTQGFRYSSTKDGTDIAILKSLSGLQSFLDLPVEFYSTRLTRAINHAEALRLRAITSAMLVGILEGYSSVRFGESHGKSLLSQNARTWAHVLAFISTEDAGELEHHLHPDQLLKGISTAIPLLSAAIDDLLSMSHEYSPLPVLSQYVSSSRRLDVTLRTPATDAGGRPVEIQCYFDRDYVSDSAISEAVSRNVSVLITPLRPDLNSLVAADSPIDKVLVLLLLRDFDAEATTRRILGLLRDAVYRDRSVSISTKPILYNFAREFPLTNPFLTRYYHVNRPSVRDLLRTFERRNGVRLWCSVRRSGKTTAGLDLGSSSGDSNVVSQTCDDTGQIQNGAVVYNRIVDALGQGTQLATGFLNDAIESASVAGDLGAQQRTVLVIDEYETLFGQLSTAAASDPRLRYTVVQPLLNQMVAFTRDNLLILMGQQPNAHFILMDQNQLSAYVEQDPFPLFSNETNSHTSEFDELVTRILTSRVSVDESFTRRIYIETAGHPFLTANLLAEFVDWLISKERSADSLALVASDFSQFATTRLRRSYLSTAQEYRFFRAAISQALSQNARRTNPWLHAIYTCLRRIALDNPETFSCTRADFENMCNEIGVESLGLTPELLLSTGEQSNFLTFGDRYVAGKIRLLTRLSAVAPIGISA